MTRVGDCEEAAYLVLVMDVAVVGAAGSVGRQIVSSLVCTGLLAPNARLQLVGRAGGVSEQILPGFAADLADAYAERLPELDLSFTAEEVRADIIIFAAGAPVSTDPRRPTDRAELARTNRPVFENYARALERVSHGEELVLVVTNPVELGVHVFAEHHPRERVIGMGAFLDTLRFRREIAASLGVRRQLVQGLVLGEHGAGMVPCFSTVRAFGFESEEGRRRIAELERPGQPDASEALSLAVRLLIDEGAQSALRFVEQLGVATRIFVKPFVMHLCGAKTVLGTAQMITRLVDTIISGSQQLAAAQLVLEGELLGIHGVTGVPAVLSNRGVERIEQLELSAAEAAGVRAAAKKVQSYFEPGDDSAS